MNVSLTPRMEELVRKKVASGLYNSSSEVIREALRLLEERDRLREMRLEELRREIAIGLEQLKRGQVSPLDIEKIKVEGRRRLAERSKQK